jgi:chromosome segregation ATPase
MEKQEVSDVVTTPAADPAQSNAQTPVADPVRENAALRGALEKMRVEFDTLKNENGLLARTANETKAALGSALVERDSIKDQLAKLAPVAKEAETLRVQVQTFTNTARESAIIDALRAKLTGAEPLAIKGVLGTLHDSGKINKFGEDAAAEAAKALELISKEAPSLLRPATVAGGSSGARETPAAPKFKSLMG